MHMDPIMPYLTATALALVIVSLVLNSPRRGERATGPFPPGVRREFIILRPRAFRLGLLDR